MSRRARAARVLGTALSIVAGAWFLTTLARSGAWDDAAWRAPSTWASIAALAVAYAALGTLLGGAWLLLVGRPDDEPRASAPVLLARYCHTQAYKYLPTNTLHLVGRHLAFRRGGYRNARLLRAAFAEQLLLALAALTLVLAALPHDARLAVDTPGASLLALIASYRAVMAVGLVGATVGAVALISRLGPVRRPWRTTGYGAPSTLVPVTLAFACHVAFFAATGYLLLVLADARFAPHTTVGYGVLAAAYALGWLLGSVTPGSPAGIGIREATLLALLGSGIAVGEVAVLALQLRLVTTLGDVLLAIVAAPGALSDRPPGSARGQHDET